MNPDVLVALIAGTSAIAAAIAGAIVKHWLEVRSPNARSTRHQVLADSPESRAKAEPAEEASAPSSLPKRKLAPSILLGLGAAGAGVVIVAVLSIKDPRWERMSDQFVGVAAFAAAVLFVAWTIIGVITRCRRVPLAYATAGGVLIAALWVGFFGTYTDVVISALVLGGSAGGILGGAVGARLAGTRAATP